jgi:hypothetical protein
LQRIKIRVLNKLTQVALAGRGIRKQLSRPGSSAKKDGADGETPNISWVLAALREKKTPILVGNDKCTGNRPD